MCKEECFVSGITERGEGVDTLYKPGIGISGGTKLISDTLLELSFHLFFVEEAAVNAGRATFLSSEVGISTTQVCPSLFLLFGRAFAWYVFRHTEADVQWEVITVGEGLTPGTVNNCFLGTI
eukprot:13954718-Ditylum_brightwellii.AAC.1